MRSASILGLVAVMAGCGGGGESDPAPPAGSAAAPAPTIQRLEGRVVDTSAAGVATASIEVWVQLPRRGYSLTWANGGQPLWSAGDGRFSLQVEEGAILVIWANKEGFAQSCGLIRKVSSNNAPLELEVLPLAAVTGGRADLPASAASATSVSGSVYELVGGERRPVANAYVWTTIFLDAAYARTVTTADGRFTTCLLPIPHDGPQGAAVGVWKEGYNSSEVWDIDPARNSSVEIELRRRTP